MALQHAGPVHSRREGRNSALPVLLPILVGTGLLVAHVLLVATGDGVRTAAWASAAAGAVLLLTATTVLWRRARSERRRARALDVARAQLQGLIDASPMAILAADHDGRILLWSRAAEETFGWTADEVTGRRYPAVPEDEEPGWRELRRRVLSGEKVRGLETRRRTRDGEHIEVSVSAAPVRDGAGAVVGTVAIIDDRSRTREMEHLETQLRQAQKLEVVGRLTAGIAHDFNNLLTAIRGNTELILAASDTPADLEVELREIARSAERAGALTRHLLTFTYQARVENQPLELNALVQGMETLMQRLIGETIELRVELSVDTGTVLMDPNQVEQILMNLVINARDALPSGGQIIVRTHRASVDADEAASLPYEVRPGPYAVISVIDNGVGMEPETAKRIFEPFFTTKPVGVGTGLGLSTVYSIIKQARGHIRVDSEPGSGTTFRVYLPSHESEQAEDGRDAPPTPTHDGGSETILLVEDEEAVLSMARRTLERQGYEVLPALSGREALGIALKYPGQIDVLFCDMVMPDLTGREVAERVRGIRPDIHVLMTSGYGERRLAAEGVLDNVAFLPKPYTPLDLTTRIRQLLAGASG